MTRTDWRGWLGQRRVAWPLAAVAGVLQTASLAPVHAWYLQVLACAILASLCLLPAPGPGRPATVAGVGAWMGVAYFSTGLWWLFYSLHDFGGLAALWSVLAVVLLALVLATYLALALWLWALGWQGASGMWRANAWVAAVWVAELARAAFFTGFPWNAPGYAHTVGPMAAWAPWVGVYGIGALVAWAVAWGVMAIGHRRRALAFAGLLGALTLPWWLPSQFTQPAGTLTVSLIQPNVAQDMKFDPARLDAQLAQLARLVGQAQGQLVVTPESVVPLARQQLSPSWWAGLEASLGDPGRGALVGIFTGQDETGYVNSLVGVRGRAPAGGGEPARMDGAKPDAAPAAQGASQPTTEAAALASASEPYVYGKRHLLPFGEYVPPGLGWFVRLLNIPIGDQATGQTQAPWEVGGQRIRPLICYEDLFGEDMVASVQGPQAATVLVNASNLAWFGPYMIQDQHLQFSQMRSLEFQRPLLRATNTGSTAAVNHLGEVVARWPALTQGVLEVTVEGRTGETPYAKALARWGLWPMWLCAFLVLLVARRRR